MITHIRFVQYSTFIIYIKQVQKSQFYMIFLTIAFVRQFLTINSRIDIESQNLKSQLATFMYSGFENLYLRVEINFGFISTRNYLTSVIAFVKSLLLYLVNLTMSAVQQSIFFSYLQERIRAAAASSDGLNLIRVMSRRDTSKMYCAKKNTSLSSNSGARRLYLSRNL